MPVTDSERPHHDQTATFLVAPGGTLGNWDRAGKITARRNPINGYRLFKRTDLEAFLKRVPRSGRQRATHRRGGAA